MVSRRMLPAATGAGVVGGALVAGPGRADATITINPRHIRPDMRIIDTGVGCAAAGYDPAARRLVIRRQHRCRPDLHL